MTPEEIKAMTPLAIMRLVAAARLKVGDLTGALQAAEAAAPYVHAKLSTAEVKMDDQRARERARIEALSEEELQAEIDEVECRMREVKDAEANDAEAQEPIH